MRRTLVVFTLLATALALGATAAQQGEAAPRAQATPVHGVIFEVYSNYG